MGDWVDVQNRFFLGTGASRARSDLRSLPDCWTWRTRCRHSLVAGMQSSTRNPPPHIRQRWEPKGIHPAKREYSQAPFESNVRAFPEKPYRNAQDRNHLLAINQLSSRAPGRSLSIRFAKPCCSVFLQPLCLRHPSSGGCQQSLPWLRLRHWESSSTPPKSKDLPGYLPPYFCRRWEVIENKTGVAKRAARG